MKKVDTIQLRSMRYRHELGWDDVMIVDTNGLNTSELSHRRLRMHVLLGLEVVPYGEDQTKVGLGIV